MGVAVSKSRVHAHAADAAYAVFAAMQREEAKHPELAGNAYWRADKRAAHDRFKSLMSRA